MTISAQSPAARAAQEAVGLPARIVEIREKTVPFKVNIRNAALAVTDLTASIVAVVTDVKRNGKPVVGYAFSSTGRPAPELQIRNRMIPRIMKGNPPITLDRAGFDPERATDLMTLPEKPGGDAERSVAVGTMEIALWDAAAKIADVPAYKLIGDRYRGGEYDKKVFSYVGCGWYVPGKTVQDLKDEVKGYLDKGFTLIKIKVGGAPVDEDVKRIEACLEVIGDPQNLCVDANGGIPAHLTHDFARAFKPFKLRWFEEPEPPHDYKAIADFTAEYGEAVAAGENLYSPIDVLNLTRFGGLRPGKDVVQWNVTQNHGISTAAKILRLLAKEGWTSRQVVPHSGNQMALNAASGLGFGMCEYYLDAFGVFGGFVDGMKVENGYVTMGDWPGFGFEQQAGLWAEMKSLEP